MSSDTRARSPSSPTRRTLPRPEGRIRATSMPPRPSLRDQEYCERALHIAWMSPFPGTVRSPSDDMPSVDGSDGDQTERTPLLKHHSVPKEASILKQPEFWAMFGIVLVMNAAYSSMTPSLWQYFAQLGGDQRWYGAGQATFNAAQIAGSLLLGRASDILPTRVVLLSTLTCGAVGALLYGVAPTWWVIFPARVLMGFSYGACPVAMATAARVATRPSQRSRAMFLVNLALPLGFFLGSAAASTLSLLHIHLGASLTLDGLTGPGYFDAFLLLLMCLLVSRVRLPVAPHCKQPTTTTTSGTPGNNTFWSEISPIAWIIVSHGLVSFSLCVVGGVFETVGTPLTTLRYDWSLRSNGLLWTCGGLLGLVAFSFPVWIAGRLPDQVVLLVCSAMVTVALLVEVSWVFPWKSDSSVSSGRYIVGFMLVQLFGYNAVASNIASLSGVLTDATQGTVLGTQDAFSAVARATTPLWSMEVFLVSPNGLFGGVALLMSLAVILVVGLLLAELSRRRNPRTSSPIPINQP